MENRAETSVWHVAVYAAVIFVGIMLIGNLMISGETVIAATQ